MLTLPPLAASLTIITKLKGWGFTKSNMAGGIAGLVAGILCLLLQRYGLFTYAVTIAQWVTWLGLVNPNMPGFDPTATGDAALTGLIVVAVKFLVTHVVETYWPSVKNIDVAIQKIGNNIPATYSDPSDFPGVPAKITGETAAVVHDGVQTMTVTEIKPAPPEDDFPTPHPNQSMRG